MKIKLISKELVEILKEQKSANEELKVIHEKLVEEDKKRKKLSFKIQRIKDKGAKILHKLLLKNYKMKELDYSGQMEIIDNKTLEVEIHNQFDELFGNIEETKKKLLELKKKKEGAWTDPKMFTGHK